jgi:hypothetical protein
MSLVETFQNMSSKLDDIQARVEQDYDLSIYSGFLPALAAVKGIMQEAIKGKDISFLELQFIRSALDMLIEYADGLEGGMTHENTDRLGDHIAGVFDDLRQVSSCLLIDLS